MASRTPHGAVASSPRRPGLLRGGPSAIAAQILAIGYLVGFTLPVGAAIASLTTTSTGSTAEKEVSPEAERAAALAGYLLVLVLALAAAAITMRTARRRLGLSWEDLGLRSTPVTQRRAPVAVLLYVALLASAVGLTVAVLAVCHVGSSGVSSGITNGPGVIPVELFHAIIAGLVEEPVLLALPIALGRRCRWSWPTTLILMIVLRIAFHLYEGWNCLFVIPWIVGAFVLYRWCSLLWPFLVAHGVFDALQVLQIYGGHGTALVAQIALAVVVAAGAAVGVVGCRRAGLFDRAR